MNNITKEKLNELLSAGEIDETEAYTIKPLTTRLTLADGESISVQASHTHYCLPRDNYPPWRCVEVGYPSVSPNEDWEEYFDGDWSTQEHTDSVYGYVPIEMVVSFINEHGGLANE